MERGKKLEKQSCLPGSETTYLSAGELFCLFMCIYEAGTFALSLTACGSPPAHMLLLWTFSMPPCPVWHWLGQLQAKICLCSAPGMPTAHGAPLSVSRTIRQQLLSKSFVARTYWQLYRLLLLILLPYREDKIPDTNGNSAASICHNYSNYIVFTLSYESVTVCT